MASPSQSRAARAVILSLAIAAPVRAGERSGTLASAALGRSLAYSVVVPSDYDARAKAGERFPVVYLLHAAGGNRRQWLGSEPGDPDVRHFIDSLHCLLVLPEDGVRFSWWMDAPAKPAWAYSTYLAKELKPRVDSLYATSPDPAHTGIAGHSMGGFGALHNLRFHPDVYGAACGMVPGVHPLRWPGWWGLDSVLGPLPLARPLWDSLDILVRAAAFRGIADRARIRIYAATRDTFFLPDDRALHAAWDSLGVRHGYFEVDGAHEYFPEARLLGVLRWFDSTFADASALRPRGRAARPAGAGGRRDARGRAGLGGVTFPAPRRGG